MLDSLEEVAQKWGKYKRNGRDSKCCEGSPEKESMPLPLPELARECDGVFSGGAKKFVWRKRHGCGVEDAAGQVDEGNDEDELERINDVIAEL